jgi:hypothetical protein
MSVFEEERISFIFCEHETKNKKTDKNKNENFFID